MNPCASIVWFDVVMSTETRVGVDGTMRERSVEVSQRFASPDGARDPCLLQTSVRIQPATTTRQNGRLVYVYRIGAGMLHLRTWCAGRYKLGIQTVPNPLPPRYTTPPYTGRTGTSIYFEVSGRGSA